LSSTLRQDSGQALHFIDANVPMYAAGAQHPLREPCLAILRAIAGGELAAITDVEVCQEILHRYTALGEREQALHVARLFTKLVPEILPITKEDLLLSLEMHERYPSLQARDSLHTAVMLNNDVQFIISADRHFDEVAEIERIDPGVPVG
jgi:predicted nucleic acid-binding protein